MMVISDIPSVTVNQQVISAEQISAEMQYHPAASRREAAVKSAQALIINEVVRQRAVALGLYAGEGPLDGQQEQWVIDKLLAAECPPAQASTAECRQYFEANRGKFATAPLLEVRHILLAGDPRDLQERDRARQLAEQILQSLGNGEGDFASLASAYSNCPSARLGGNLGQISKGQTVPEFERQLFGAAQGIMAKPVESRYGFHVVEVVRRVKGNPLPFEQVRADIQSYLDTKVRRKASAQYITRLLSESDIQGFDFGLDGSPLMQ
ncbi:peptidylprolyl isomerase [Bowmanella yangjiangensis]|uniref:peptidylprolyl isomerase n=1 Tax=Bowmanella yangjiangensis TaxID=2811230 RepID=UPI001E3C46F3|nr:peptidylprolyl isomerase [Bowmanella yangjiangensis]